MTPEKARKLNILSRQLTESLISIASEIADILQERAAFVVDTPNVPSEGPAGCRLFKAPELDTVKF